MIAGWHANVSNALASEVKLMTLALSCICSSEYREVCEGEKETPGDLKVAVEAIRPIMAAWSRKWSTVLFHVSECEADKLDMFGSGNSTSGGTFCWCAR